MAVSPVVLWNVCVAVLSGLAVGIERQWSGHAAGPHARFAGVRTFTLLGLVSGLSGWLWTAGLQGPAVVFLAGLGALVVVAYLAASRRDVDGTTEVAAFVVMAAGVLAGAGLDAVASAVTAVTVLLLVEKRQLHRMVSKIDRDEIRAGARFAVMAAVVLPLLPTGPYGPFGSIRPRFLWAFVLFFSGLSFIGYIARRGVGRDRGYALAGAIGGLLSSTSVTFTFAELSRQEPEAGRALAAGAIGANTVLFPRVLVATLVLAPVLAAAVWPRFVVPAAVGVVLLLRGIRAPGRSSHLERRQNPLQFKNALQMAAAFQVVLWGVAFARAHFGAQGVLGSAFLLGTFDVDAVTISLAQMAHAGASADLMARAMTMAVLANTLVKLGITLAIGRGRFRSLTAAGLALMGGTLAAAVFW